MVKTEAFPTIRMKIDRLLKITNEYQFRFFNEHKEDEKFQRRIDYLRENADQVIQQLGCTDYIGYKVIPYMCMNKVLVSRYKKVTFPIVSYPELVEIISGATRE